MMEIETIEKVNLPQFVKLVKDYIRVYPQENKLYACYDISQKIKGKIEKIRCYIETDIPIKTTTGHNCIMPKTINLHHTNSDTLKTLLALKPESLEIDYWENNQSEYMRERCINQESVFITGLKGKNRYRIEVSGIYSSEYSKMGMQ
jgi:hypothetical protein